MTQSLPSGELGKADIELETQLLNDGAALLHSPAITLANVAAQV
jgi:hypothetical protein